MNHPSIIVFNKRSTDSKLSFSYMKKNDIFKEIKNLQINKKTGIRHPN